MRCMWQQKIKIYLRKRSSILVIFFQRHSYQIWYFELSQVSSNGGISSFWISGQSLIKENCHNYRTSHDIDMKLRPVTKIDKTKKTASKKSGESANIDVIVSFSIYGLFGATPKPDSWCCKICIFINTNSLSYKRVKTELKILLHSSHNIDLGKGTFFKKTMLASAKLKRSWFWKTYFLKLHMCVNLPTKFQVSSKF